MRVGIGYDVHRLVPGRRLVLGGVEFAGPVGLLGHSDADVVMHALADAVLGAAALGDLGDHFPPTDERWRDAAGARILARAVELAAERGWSIVNVDVNILAQAPHIGGRKQEMRAHIAGVLDVPSERVSVKARTAERLGAVGAEQAIEAQAVVLLAPLNDDA